MEKVGMPVMKIRLLILFAGMLLYFPFLGNAHLFDWDEVNFAESAREMIVSGNYSRVQINFQPFWEKPPLFFWLQVFSMKLFGINEYAARFPNALFGVLTLLTVFEMGRKLKGNQFGFIWAVSLAVSFLPHVYFKSGIIDPIFNYFIFTSIWFIAISVQEESSTKTLKFLICSGLLTGLAILTKGPVGLLMPGLAILIFWVLSGFNKIISLKGLAVWLTTAFLVSLAWFGPETLKNGTWFLEEFIKYHIRLLSTPDAGHAQPVYYHFLVVLLGCFPMSVIALHGMFKKDDDPMHFGRWMKVLFWTVMILFSLVTTKIVHYSSLAYLPLSFLAARTASKLINGQIHWAAWNKIAFVIIGILPATAFFLLPLAGMNPHKLAPYIKDPFARETLNASIPWSLIDFLPSLFWIIGLLVSVIFMIQKAHKKSLAAIACFMLLSVSGFLYLIPEKIAGYSQLSACNFYKGLKGKDVYVETLGFKSYAQYFYFQKPGFTSDELENSLDENGIYNIDALRTWYLSGKIDKPVHFAVKNLHAKEYLAMPEIQQTGSENGFIFLVRYPHQIKY